MEISRSYAHTEIWGVSHGDGVYEEVFLVREGSLVGAGAGVTGLRKLAIKRTYLGLVLGVTGVLLKMSETILYTFFPIKECTFPLVLTYS